MRMIENSVGKELNPSIAKIYEDKRMVKSTFYQNDINLL
jgi:hypothetical protein